MEKTKQKTYQNQWGGFEVAVVFILLAIMVNMR